MITLKKLNGQDFVINSDLIETIEKTPDTVVSVTTGNKYIVQETKEEIISKVIEYKSKIILLAQNTREDK